MPAATTTSVAVKVAPSAPSAGMTDTTSVTVPIVARTTLLRVSAVVRSRMISAPTHRMIVEESAGARAMFINAAPSRWS
jgi:hypothetical protein